jgi:hypothetical protein
MTEHEDWTRAFALLAWDGTQWVAVKVADDGSLYAVLQGDYEGTLTTVALDDAGRISAFVIDSSDAWGRLLSIGNAELAARLGSPVRFDRRGQVVLMETFEAGLQRWYATTYGTNAAVTHDPTTALTGGYSVKMENGDDAANYAQIFHECGVRPAGRVGASAAFALSTTIGSLALFIDYYTATSLLHCGVRFQEDGSKLQYLDSTSAWQDIAVWKPCTRIDQAFNQMKLVADLSAGEYVRVLANGSEYDLSGTAVNQTAGTYSPHYAVYLHFIGRSGDTDYCFIDDVILTVAEPE